VCLFFCEGSKLADPRLCPMQGCTFFTYVRRARPSHLLRDHHLLFRGRGMDPLPLTGAELAEHLEAFRRRNRGSRQRARENQRFQGAVASSSGRLAASASEAVADPVVDPPANAASLEDEDWGAAVVDWQLLLEEDVLPPDPSTVAGTPAAPSPEQHLHQDWLAVPYVPPPPPELEGLPGGVSPVDFVEQVMAWGANNMPYRDKILLDLDILTTTFIRNINISRTILNCTLVTFIE